MMMTRLMQWIESLGTPRRLVCAVGATVIAFLLMRATVEYGVSIALSSPSIGLMGVYVIGLLITFSVLLFGIFCLSRFIRTHLKGSSVRTMLVVLVASVGIGAYISSDSVRAIAESNQRSEAFISLLETLQHYSLQPKATMKPVHVERVKAVVEQWENAGCSVASTQPTGTVEWAKDIRETIVAKCWQ
ncbi:hypothetical protein [Marinimicrobium sp. ABcell2]|uniref:hypothetical protein n=1 Tax=Marinimicrobium sp. ABcell2 TaxID=3069751 RepID=UPI0027AEFCE3|nr:hypothetical protein [Marinimicrobium sp. ABcell2]MDQ2077427.1 hypothetical protein [Marinimicrobium sp. ABcell2]